MGADYKDFIINKIKVKLGQTGVLSKLYFSNNNYFVWIFTFLPQKAIPSLSMLEIPISDISES